MRYAISLGNAGPGGPRAFAELASLAEASGWDAIFLEDYLVYQNQVGVPTYDPWMLLATMATATDRIRLGTMVTPLPRRRPAKLAAETITLDHLSNGRVILGVGAGDGADASFRAAGEPSSARVLADRLDEGLAGLTALWAGRPVSFEGQHLRLDGLQLTPTPVQRPRIPIWVGGDWLRPRVRQRLVRWDGACLYKGTPGTATEEPLNADDVRGMADLAASARGTAEGFDICVGGLPRGADEEAERSYVRSLAAAGATWWQEWVKPGDLERTRQAVARGPLRID